MILDHIRDTHDGTILVPGFHRGHLSLVPGAQLYVSLIEPPPRDYGNGHCELILTPFATPHRNLSHLTCTLVDQPGVVNRLIEAVAALGINIVKEESTSINSSHHHVVELVLDWSTQGASGGGTPPLIQHRLRWLACRFPIHLQDYVTLYYAIMARCGDVIVIDRHYATPLPSLTIAPFPPSNAKPAGIVEIERIPRPVENGSRREPPVQFALSEVLQRKIRTFTDITSPAPLRYILSSEPALRSLRAFFPMREVSDRILHVALPHADKPGALSSITRALARNHFNILTSLSRVKPTQSLYEAVLEFRGEGTLPPTTSNDPLAVARWLHAKLTTPGNGNGDGHELAELQYYQVGVGTPEYPRRAYVDAIPIHSDDGPRKPNLPIVATTEMVNQCIVRSETAPSDAPADILQARRRLLHDIRGLIERKPTIFLSCPRAAAKYSDRLKGAIGKEFPGIVVTDYQSPNLQRILETVIELIEDCDYFIGIWHHEQLPQTRKAGQRRKWDRQDERAPPSLSPWMPFEYGMARNLGKEWIVIHSDRLPEDISTRIDSSISLPSYNERSFEKKTIPIVLDHIGKHWANRTS